MTTTLTDTDFKGFSRLVCDLAGIQMGPAKKPLVFGVLAKRLGHHGIDSYGDYLELVQQDATERQTVLDLLTTNETYFFREPRHFAFLAENIAPSLRQQGAVRVWSGACSTGEEPYTLAMVLMHALGHSRFEILASDISTRVLHQARQGLYPISEAKNIPWSFRSSYCIKGVGGQEGHFLIDRPIREKVLFEQINLNAPLPDIGQFDVVFMRNVMMYFSLETKRALLSRLMASIKPGGWLVIGHSESLHGLTDELKMIRPSIFQRPLA